jgi:hypothetical protein
VLSGHTDVVPVDGEMDPFRLAKCDAMLARLADHLRNGAVETSPGES